MTQEPKPSPVDVYSASEIAEAAGVPLVSVEALVADGQLRPIAGSPHHLAAAAARCGPSVNGPGAAFFSISLHSSTPRPKCLSRSPALYMRGLPRP